MSCFPMVIMKTTAAVNLSLLLTTYLADSNEVSIISWKYFIQSASIYCSIDLIPTCTVKKSWHWFNKWWLYLVYPWCVWHTISKKRLQIKYMRLYKLLAIWEHQVKYAAKLLWIIDENVSQFRIPFTGTIFAGHGHVFIALIVDFKHLEGISAFKSYSSSVSDASSPFLVASWCLVILWPREYHN